MSYNGNGLKVKKDAAVSALFSLYKAAGDASSAILDLINHLESTGLDVSDLRSAFTGENPANSSISTNKPVTTKEAIEETTEEVPSKQQDTNESSPLSAEGGDVENGRKKPKRAPKDPNAPKRPLNAFLKFRNQESKKISEERKSKGEPDLSRADMSTAVKEHWENLPESVRENLIQESKSDLERYHSNLATYKESNNASQALAESSQPELSQPELSQASQSVLTQDEGQDDSSSQPKKKSKKRDDSKKDDKEKKKRKKQHTEE